jgi:carbon-monoxide dehydrogenase medium subunit
MAARAPEVLAPGSAGEAVKAFGTGSGVTVLAGGTIVMPELVAGGLRPRRVLMLGGAKLGGVTRKGGVVSIGATTPIEELTDGDEPLATAARHVGDIEIRGQATVGGNVCARGGDAPRGDLQAPLIALGARVVFVADGRRRRLPIEDFLARPASRRLVLAVEYDDVSRSSGYAVARRPHAHHYSILAVCCTRSPAGVRVAVSGAGPHGLRCRSVEEALAAGVAPADAAARVLADVGRSLRDDALASAWYRRRVLPTLTAGALAQLGKGPA